MGRYFERQIIGEATLEREGVRQRKIFYQVIIPRSGFQY